MVVDDDPLVRSGLQLLLGGESDVRVTAEASTGQEAVVGHRREPVDVILMDLRMPGLDGIEATRILKSEPAPPAIIVLTTFDADDHVVRALSVGADGFLLKDTPPTDILAAIRNVLAGRPALSPSVTTALIRQVVDASRSANRPPDDGVGALTDRELDVARALAIGSSNAEIAGELYMSVATVKAHISHIFAKLGVGNRVQVAIRIHDAGLV